MPHSVLLPQQVSLLYDSLPDPVWIFENWRGLQVNEAAVRKLGFQDKRSLLAAGPWEYSPRVQPDGEVSKVKALRMMALAREQGHCRFEWVHTHRDGRLLPGEVTLTSVQDGERELSFCFWRDLTELRRLEKEVLHSRTRFQTLFEESPDPVWLISNRRFVDCNRAAVLKMGYESKEELCNTYPWQLSPEFQPDGQDSYTKAHALIAQALHDGVHRFEWVHQKRDGHCFDAEVTLTRMELDGQTVIHCVWRDITARKQAEEALRNMAQDLQVAVDAAQQASEAKSRFLASVSHEIRTPLNAVLGMAQILQEEGLSESERRSHVSTILDSGHVLLNLLNDILDLSRIESGQLKLEQRPMSPDQVTLDVCALFRESARRKGVALRMHREGAEGLQCLADDYRLRQMLSNLVGNALKFTARGEVRVTQKVLGRLDIGGEHLAWLEWSVQDTGIGIALDKQQELFTPFYQADSSTTRRFGGTGLGLSIVSRLAEQMGGEVGLESQEGEGARFWFRVGLPIRCTPQTQAGGQTVALLESHPVQHSLCKMLLEKLQMKVVSLTHLAELESLFLQEAAPQIVMVGSTPGTPQPHEVLHLLRGAPTAAATGRVRLLALAPDEATLPAHTSEWGAHMAGVDALVEWPLSLNGLRRALAEVLAEGHA